jgi:formyl-CoA transferase
VALLKRLAEKADVVVENFRPDVKHRLGIDYEALSAVNPRLIYASISGFGQDGPYAGRPGFDQIAQGMGGLMSITGLPGQGPVRVGIPIADLCSGFFAAHGIMLALYERERSGKGQWVQTSLLQAQSFILDFQAARWLQAGEVPKQAGNNHPTSIPTGVFPTSDGHMNIAATGNVIWKRLCQLLGAPEWEKDPRFADGKSRSANRDVLNALIAERTKSDTSANWVEKMNDAGVPCGPIYSIDQTFNDPQVKHLGIARKVEHAGLGTLGVVGQPINMSAAAQPETLRMATPELGEHTDALLAELGYDADAVAQLRQHNVV